LGTVSPVAAPYVAAMGLAITVGIEREFTGIDEEATEMYRSRLRELSAELANESITWTEPALGELPPSRVKLIGFSYSLVHYLRRVSALHGRGDDVTPVAPGEDLDDEPEEDATCNLSSHLICHSDCDGYYVPVDFDDPIFLDGGAVGSSQQLLRELQEVAEPIGIHLEADGSLSDAEAERVANVSMDNPYRMEWEVWLALFEAARINTTTGHAIVFH
jgi:hypothetical protein